MVIAVYRISFSLGGRHTVSDGCRRSTYRSGCDGSAALLKAASRPDRGHANADPVSVGISARWMWARAPGLDDARAALNGGASMAAELQDRTGNSSRLRRAIVWLAAGQSGDETAGAAWETQILRSAPVGHSFEFLPTAVKLKSEIPIAIWR